MYTDSIIRTQEHKEFKNISLTGAVLDLGGECGSEYINLISGVYTVTKVNLSKEVGCDVVHDLEVAPLPFESNSFDAVVLNNTLEHIFHARELLSEAVRIAKPGGSVIVTVPFLFPIHPSPHDYWRFTEEALRQMFKDCGVQQIKITPLGVGVFTVCFNFIERVLPRPLRFLSYFVRPIATFFDWLLFEVVHTNKSFIRKDYHSVGYFVVGIK